MLIRNFSQSFHKQGKINIPDGDHFILNMNLLLFNADNFVHGNKIGSVNPNKTVARKQIFHLFHRLKTLLSRVELIYSLPGSQNLQI